MVATLISTIESEEEEPIVVVTEEAQKAVDANLSEKTELQNLFTTYLNSQFK
jgi:hypothetical protein